MAELILRIEDVVPSIGMGLENRIKKYKDVAYAREIESAINLAFAKNGLDLIEVPVLSEYVLAICRYESGFKVIPDIARNLPLKENVKDSTTGIMEVSVAKAKEMYGFESVDETRKFLQTVNGGIDAGISMLLDIVKSYSLKASTNESLDYVFKEHKDFVLADYNAGKYSSRNAGFQYAIDSIMLDLVKKGNISKKDYKINKIDIDGSLGKGTKNAIDLIVKYMDIDVDSDDISKSRLGEFEKTKLYKSIMQVADTEKYVLPEDAWADGGKYKGIHKKILRTVFGDSNNPVQYISKIEREIKLAHK